MKCRILLALIAFGFGVPAYGQDDACAHYDGAVVVSDDGEYLGKITNSYASDSIFNEYGKYGSEYRSNSIWNQYGKNGSEYRTNSAFNEYSAKPPMIIKNNRIVGRLTVNKSVAGAVNPIVLGAVCYDFEPPR